MVVSPSSTTCECSRHPSPNCTFPPTTQYGPISQPAPSCALGSTTAVGWIFVITNRKPSPSTRTRPVGQRFEGCGKPENQRLILVRFSRAALPKQRGDCTRPP